MNLSRGRPETRLTASTIDSSSAKKKAFVFGSSTPRELSHIGGTLKNARLLGAKVKEPAAAGDNEHSLSYYMRQARSITPAESGGRHGVASWAFGSSTPREFSHLRNIKPEQRVYDAKIVHKAEARSLTTSALAAEKPVEAPKPKPKTGKVAKKPARKMDADDASSEPDIVQDRGFDFHRNTRLAAKKLLEGANKDVAKNDVKHTPAAGGKGTKEKSVKKAVPTKGIATKPSKPATDIQKQAPAKKEAISSAAKPKTPNENKQPSETPAASSSAHEKELQQEKVRELATESRQAISLVNEEMHDEMQKAVRVPTVRARDDTSEVLVDDVEIVPVAATVAPSSAAIEGAGGKENNTAASDTKSPRAQTPEPTNIENDMPS